ncbi:hypothetical protein [Jiangella gansuensis]|uniref:hypothetical protein n=1 Tax=Jiangella gansuensis TaxID=281473 RepID=UPI00047E13A2|nr:hypothetical protein [Jiangella gansuensis]
MIPGSAKLHDDNESHICLDGIRCQRLSVNGLATFSYPWRLRGYAQPVSPAIGTTTIVICGDIAVSGSVVTGTGR